MKAFLMYKDRDFDMDRKPPWNEQALVQDLELNTLFGAMADGDKFLFQVAKVAVLSGYNDDLPTILYRQSALKDCLRNPEIVRYLYDLAVTAIENEKKVWSFWAKYPAGILSRARDVLGLSIPMLRKLRAMAEEHAEKFDSEGFSALFNMLKKELDDEYLNLIEWHLKEVKFRDGVLISAELGKGNQGRDYVLRKPQATDRSWFKRMFASGPPVYTFHLHPRDESGAQALSDLNNRGINLVANALAQSSDHVVSFFKMLRTELAFYAGCLNLHERLASKGEPITFPVPFDAPEWKLAFRGLYDVCLTLTMEGKTVGTDVNADNKDMVIITGANQGGKSTFLRSIGVGQLMMQSGMFVGAESFRGSICGGVFTHYKREEDVTMKSGKLDEELSRMSHIADHMRPAALVLFNESVAATNEREGSEIAMQITSALLEKGIRVFFVTHLYEFAHRWLERRMAKLLFLRAERLEDGTRTFRMIEGEPLETSHGPDLYERIFSAREERPETARFS
jgi:DNA mismatch repair ATPase MutS